MDVSLPVNHCTLSYFLTYFSMNLNGLIALVRVLLYVIAKLIATNGIQENEGVKNTVPSKPVVTQVVV